MATYNIHELEDQMFWGDGLPENMTMNDYIFAVDGIVLAKVVGKTAQLMNGAIFASGGFKPDRLGNHNALLFVDGTIIEMPGCVEATPEPSIAPKPTVWAGSPSCWKDEAQKAIKKEVTI